MHLRISRRLTVYELEWIYGALDLYISLCYKIILLELID